MNYLKRFFMKKITIYKILAFVVTLTVVLGSCTKEMSEVRLEPTLSTSQTFGVNRLARKHIIRIDYLFAAHNLRNALCSCGNYRADFGRVKHQHRRGSLSRNGQIDQR